MDLERRPWWHKESLLGTRTPVQTDRQLRELIANYYGMISLIDHNVGRILAALDEFGLAEDTLVVYSTDHGDWLGDHGLILKGPMAYEGLLRVGLLVRGPDVPRGKVVTDPVSTIDLPKTFADFAGVTLADARHSRSLKPLIAGGGARDFAFSEWDLRASRCGVDLWLRTVRTRTHKLTVESNSGAGEIYDLVNDPQAMDNRFGDPGVKAAQRELEDMIASRPGDKVAPLPQVGMA
jgi:arylsulfatase A-like enzyme